MVIPEFDDVVTDEWFMNILKDGTWDPEHGSPIGSWLDNLRGEVFAPRYVLPSHLIKSDDAEALDDPALQDILLKWLHDRYSYVRREIGSAETYRIGRRMTVTSDWLDDLTSGIATTGIYWGDLPLDDGGFWHDASKPIEIYMEIEAQPDDIDWIKTFRARMDYELGDDERERRLIENRNITIKTIKVDGDERPDLAGVTVSTGKPWPRMDRNIGSVSLPGL